MVRKEETNANATMDHHNTKKNKNKDIRTIETSNDTELQPALRKKKRNQSNYTTVSTGSPSTGTHPNRNHTHMDAITNTSNTVENQKLVEHMYHAIVVDDPTNENSTTVHTFDTATSSHPHYNIQRYKYVPHLRTLVWPVFFTMVQQQQQQQQEQVGQDKNDQGTNTTKPTTATSLLSIPQVAQLVAHLLSMEYQRDGGNVVTESTLDFIGMTEVQGQEGKKEDHHHDNNDATWMLTCWNEFCHAIFGNDVSNNITNRNDGHDDDETDTLSSHQKQQVFYTDWTIRTHCMTILWSCLSQQYYFSETTDPTTVADDDDDVESNSCHTPPQSQSLRHFKRDMFLILCQNYIATNTIHISMPPRYREWYMKRTHVGTNHLSTTKPDDTVAKEYNSTSNHLVVAVPFLVRMIHQVLQVFESDDIRWVPNQSGTTTPPPRKRCSVVGRRRRPGSAWRSVPGWRLVCVGVTPS